MLVTDDDPGLTPYARRMHTLVEKLKKGIEDDLGYAKETGAGHVAMSISRAKDYVGILGELLKATQPTGEAPTEVFVLLADGDGTTRSSDNPFGVAVTTEEEAQRFVREGGVGYSHSYAKVRVFADKDAGFRHAYPSKKVSP